MTALVTAAEAELAREVRILSHYLIGQSPSARVVDLYAGYLRSNPHDLDPGEQHLYAIALRRPYLLGLIDAGLGLVDPNGGIRRRLLACAALLETSLPTHAAFLPKSGDRSSLLVIALLGVSAVLKALFGVALLKLLTWSR